MYTGWEENYNWFSFHMGNSFVSSWRSYPERFKFTGFDLYLDTHLYKVSRTSYDALNFVGDIGGLMEGLTWIGLLLTTWYSERYRDRFLMTNLF